MLSQESYARKPFQTQGIQQEGGPLPPFMPRGHLPNSTWRLYFLAQHICWSPLPPLDILSPSLATRLTTCRATFSLSLSGHDVTWSCLPELYHFPALQWAWVHLSGRAGLSSKQGAATPHGPSRTSCPEAHTDHVSSAGMPKAVWIEHMKPGILLV